MYRFDKKVPGETWSRAYVWKTGQETTCCYIDLCRETPCQPGDSSRMTPIVVEKGATDLGPVTGGEHWQKHDDIKILKMFSTEDWVVDPSGNIVQYTQNASIRGTWIKEASAYSDVKLGNLTEADFAYPKVDCDSHMCDGSAGQVTLQTVQALSTNGF